MALDSGGGGPTITLQQLIKPLEHLDQNNPSYDVFREPDLRVLLRHVFLLKPDISDPGLESLPFWDAFVALTYHSVYQHRHPVADKGDRALENSICDVAKVIVDYCVQRLRKPTGSSFLTMADNVKLIAGVYSLGGVYAKNEVATLFQQLRDAPTPALLVDNTESEHQEERKEVRYHRVIFVFCAFL